MAEGLVGGEGFAVDASLITADASWQKRLDGADGLPTDRSSRAIDDYLDVLDDAAFGGASEVTPKYVSPTDPAARWTGATRGPAVFAYSTNYLIDLDHAIIVDVEPSSAIRTAETSAAKTMIERTEKRHGLSPKRLAGDMGYGSGEGLGWLVDDRDIEPHIPVWDKSRRDDGTFSREDFAYDDATDAYTCPGGKPLTTTGTVHDGRTLLYRASSRDCEPCPLKARCCPNTPHRRIPRDVNERARDRAREIARTEAYLVSCRQRKKVEMLFAHLKRILRLGRLRLRGPTGARDEFLLAATAQNLRKMAKLIPMPQPAMA